MKVFVIGATGVLGREAVPRLRAAGHEVGVLDAPAGVYNVGAPVLKRDLGITRLPKGFGRLAASFEVFARSQRVVSGKLTAATGWKPRSSPEWND